MPTSTRRAESTSSAAFRTPWGEGLVFVRGGLLVGVMLPGGQSGAPTMVVGENVPAASTVAQKIAAPALDQEALKNWVSGLEAYFRGERLGWSQEEVPVEAVAATPFRRSVYRALLAVPPGVTLSYGELAEEAGHPGAARAVGTAMACNPIPVVIPCHRVILADRRLGDYGEDPTWKERLLQHERAYLPSVGPTVTAGGPHG